MYNILTICIIMPLIILTSILSSAAAVLGCDVQFGPRAAPMWHRLICVLAGNEHEDRA
jgi:hypothetical protein